MKTDNAMQLKAKIKRKAKELNVPPQIMFQNYMMEDAWREVLGR